MVRVNILESTTTHVKPVYDAMRRVNPKKLPELFSCKSLSSAVKPRSFTLWASQVFCLILSKLGEAMAKLNRREVLTVGSVASVVPALFSSVLTAHEGEHSSSEEHYPDVIPCTVVVPPDVTLHIEGHAHCDCEDETYAHLSADLKPGKKKGKYDVRVKLPIAGNPTIKLANWTGKEPPARLNIEVVLHPEEKRILDKTKHEVIMQGHRLVFFFRPIALGKTLAEARGDFYHPCCIECDGVLFCGSPSLTVICNGIEIACNDAPPP